MDNLWIGFYAHFGVIFKAHPIFLNRKNFWVETQPHNNSMLEPGVFLHEKKDSEDGMWIAFPKKVVGELEVRSKNAPKQLFWRGVANSVWRASHVVWQQPVKTFLQPPKG